MLHRILRIRHGIHNDNGLVPGQLRCVDGHNGRVGHQALNLRGLNRIHRALAPGIFANDIGRRLLAVRRELSIMNCDRILVDGRELRGKRQIVVDRRAGGIHSSTNVSPSNKLASRLRWRLGKLQNPPRQHQLRGNPRISNLEDDFIVRVAAFFV